MTKNNTLAALVVGALLMTSTASFAQEQKDPQKQRPRTTTGTQDKNKKPVNGDRLEPDDTSSRPSDMPNEMVANRQEQMSEEEAAINPYYNNFFSTYRLGPEDIISVEVFNQDRYTRKGITVPPNGRISLQLIPGGVFVNGKTPEQVARMIEKEYEEYILTPQVTVILEKAASYRYSILGDVLQPGVRLMNRRMTVTEAIAEARRATELSAAQTSSVAFEGYALAKLGKRDEARAIAEKLKSLSKERFIPPYHIAMVYNGLGERDEVFTWLERALEQHDPKLTFLKVDPKWNNLRDDPRFQNVMRRVGF